MADSNHCIFMISCFLRLTTATFIIVLFYYFEIFNSNNKCSSL